MALAYGLVALAGGASLWAILVGPLKPEHPLFVCQGVAPGVLVCAPVPRSEIAPLLKAQQ